MDIDGCDCADLLWSLHLSENSLQADKEETCQSQARPTLSTSSFIPPFDSNYKLFIKWLVYYAKQDVNLAN